MKLYVVYGIVMVVVLFSACNQDPAPPEKPNFLFILVDDLGYRDLSCMGSDFYETPNIDRIAETGTRFLHGYSTCQVCSPSRASILTGQYTPGHGITDYIGAPTGEEWKKLRRHQYLLPPGYNHYLDHEFTTFPEVLKEAGYRTFFAGKWHLGSAGDSSLPVHHGFEINRGGYHAGGPYAGGFFAPFNNPYLEDCPEEEGKHLSLRLAEETARFIRQYSDEPFLAYLAFYAVHAPIQTTREKWSYYRKKADSMGIAEAGFEMERILPIRKYQDNPVYAGLIEHVDEGVGLVLKTLEEMDLDKNTVVIFTSDNGGVASGDNYSTSIAPLRGGKGYQWEGGTRVPLLVRIPWLERQKDVEVPVSGIDFYPTILELAGLAPPEVVHLDGLSIVPLLSGEKIEERPLFWHYPHHGNQGGEPCSAIQQGVWKLIHYWKDGRTELYKPFELDGERQDLAADHPDIRADLDARLLQWLEETEATLPYPDPGYNEDSLRMVQEGYRTTTLERVERNRSEMLKPGWEPNEDWWGSEKTGGK